MHQPCSIPIRPKYIVAEEESESPGNGSVVILSEKWLTPKKFEAFWPSSKLSGQFNKLLLKHHEPDKEWPLIKIKRKFFETEDLIIARKKAKQAEVNSDIDVTDADEDKTSKRRPKPVRFQSDHETSSDDEIFDATDIFKQKGTVTPKKSQSVQPSITLEQDQIHYLASSSTAALEIQQQKQTPLSTTRRQTSAGTTPGYETKILQLLSTIVEQNKQILDWIRQQNELEVLNSKATPIELPVQLPLNDLEELTAIETYLTCDNKFTNFCNYLVSHCGHSTTTSINQLLKHCMTNELASQFNFRGKNNKRAFEELYLKTAIIRAVKKHFKLTVEKDLENDIKVWLKHAPQRAKARLTRNNSQSLASSQRQSL